MNELTEPTRPGRAAPLAPEDRRDAILTAVLPLLLERGVEVTTRELAVAAGVAEGTLFRVFPDKKAIVRAAVARALDPAPMLAALEAVDPAGELREILERAVAVLQARARDVVATMVVAYYVLAGDEDDPALAVARRAKSKETGQAGERVVEGLTALLRQHSAELRRPVEECARFIVAVVYATARPGPVGVALAMSPAELVDFLLHGLRDSSADASKEGRC